MYLEYIDNGQDKNILMIHSYPASSRIFRKHQEILKSRFNIILVDLPGFGESDPLKDFSIRGIVSEIVSEVGTRNVDIIWGVSFGGIVSLELENLFKPSLLVLESVPFNSDLVHTNELKILNRLEKLLGSSKLLQYFMSMKNNSRRFRAFLISLYKIVNWGKIYYLDSEMDYYAQKINARTLFDVARFLQKFDSTKQLEESNSEKIFVYDRRDPVIYFDESKEFFKNSKIIEFDFGEHAPSVLYPEIVAKEVVKLIP